MHTLACCHFPEQRNHAYLLQYTPGVPYHEMVEDVAPKVHFDHRVMDVSYFCPLGLRFLRFSNVPVHLDQLKPAQTCFVYQSLSNLPHSVVPRVHSGQYQGQILDILQSSWCVGPLNINKLVAMIWFPLSRAINSKFEQSLSTWCPTQSKWRI